MSPRAKRNMFRPELGSLENRELLAADFVAGVSGFVFPTDQLQVTYATRGFTGNFDVALFRSKDSTLDSSDVLLGTRTLVSRSATATQTATINLTPPVASDPQRPFFIVQLNPRNTVPEASNARANNTWFFIAPYNQALFSDAQMRDTSPSVGQIRNFLTQKGSYFRNLVLDFDNKFVDLPQVISTASTRFRISPKILVTLLENQLGVVTSGARPNTVSILGNSGRTWGAQVVEAARLLDQFMQQAAAGQATGTGWRRLVARNTLDGITVIAANNAMTALFSYTPYAGGKWGGSNTVGGMYRFTSIYRAFGF